jgi:hypothetical protein
MNADVTRAIANNLFETAASIVMIRAFNSPHRAAIQEWLLDSRHEWIALINEGAPEHQNAHKLADVMVETISGVE